MKSLLPSHIRQYSGHYRQLALLGLPIVAGQAGMILVSFADNVMVGHYSTEALASASFVNNIFNTAMLTCIGFSYGLTPLVGALFGRGERSEIGRLMRSGLVLNLIFALLITAAMGVVYAYMDRLGQPVELLPVIRPYFLLYLAGLVPVALFNVFAQWSYGIKHTAMPMVIILAANLANVAGNYALIYGHWGCPEMGLTGAGISTLAARWACAVIIMGIYFRRKANRPYRDGFASARVTGSMMRHISATSWPVALQMGFETGSFSISAVMAGWLGPVELAAFQVMVVVGSLGFCFYYSLGTATSVLVANAAGHDDRREMRCIGFAGYHLTLLMAVAASLAFALAGRHLIAIFSTDPAVIATAMTLIPPLILYQLADATQVNFANALRGTAKVMPMLWIAFISYMVVGIPATYLLGFPLGGGIVGIFFSFTVSLLLAASLFLYFFIKHTRIRSKQ